MTTFKRAVTFVCVWLGGNDPAQERMPSEHSWLVPGPSLLNTFIAWANPPQPILAVATARRPGPRR